MSNASVTDEGLMQLVTQCPELSLLDFQATEGKGKITDKFFDFLIQFPHSLYYINCWGHLGISLRAATAFAKRFPNTQIVSVYSTEELGLAKPKGTCRPAHQPPPLPDDVE
jgi:hypothetical protein